MSLFWNKLYQTLMMPFTTCENSPPSLMEIKDVNTDMTSESKDCPQPCSKSEPVPVKSPYIGKYVCYSQMDGGACFGKIKDECKVNTVKGEKPVFILTDRIVRHHRCRDSKNFRIFYPTMKMGAVDADGKMTGEELDFGIWAVPGDSILRQDMIDLEHDVLDLQEMLGKIDRDRLFVIILEGFESGLHGQDALELGLRNLMGKPESSELIKQEFRRRLNSEKEGLEL